MENYKTKGHIPFDEVCKNRSIIVPIISEGNVILKDIIDYCVERYLIDKSIETFECCEGQDSYDASDYEYFEEVGSYYATYVMFNIPTGSEQYIYSIIDSINQIARAKYRIGQNKKDNMLLLDVRLSYLDRESANQFLMAVKEGLINYKNNKMDNQEITNIIKLLKNVYRPQESLVIQRERNKDYLAVFVKSRDGSLLNQLATTVEDFNKKGITEVQPEYFMNKDKSSITGIQKTKRMY